MSFPTDEVCCGKCQQTWVTNDWFNQTIYENKKGKPPWVPTSISWCLECEQITYSENFKNELKNQQWYLRHIRRLHRLRKGLSAEVLTPPTFRERKSLTDKRTPDAKNPQRYDFRSPIRNTLKQAIDDLNKRLRESEYWLSFIETRKSPPKCLRCGNSNFKLLNIGWEKESVDDQTSIHPGCGGKLHQQNGEMRFMMAPLYILFNTEGDKIDSDRPEYRQRSRFFSN